MTYYNDFEPFAVEWLKNLSATGHITQGRINGRSIVDVKPEELREMRRVHLFAGVGGWDLALRLAGWPVSRSVWTVSCPCQPFSNAGKRKGHADARNLWLEVFRLVRGVGPGVVFGEQVPSAIGMGWLDRVFDDLESECYTCGAAVLPACSVGAPHIRARLYWVANSDESDVGKWEKDVWETESTGGGEDGSWRDSILIPCTDGKARRIGRGVFPLVNGIPRDLGRGIPELRQVARSASKNRNGRLKGYGNAIVPYLAGRFVRAYMDVAGIALKSGEKGKEGA